MFFFPFGALNCWSMNGLFGQTRVNNSRVANSGGWVVEATEGWWRGRGTLALDAMHGQDLMGLFAEKRFFGATRRRTPQTQRREESAPLLPF